MSTKEQMLGPGLISRVIAYLLFYPTLLWNSVLASTLQSRRWWDVVDDHVIIGGLPRERHVIELHRMGVRAVVNLCAEATGPTGLYEELGIACLRLPTIDFSSPNLRQVEEGIAFIAAQASCDHRTYVHCKAGRGRSATLVLCWLMTRYGMTPGRAQARLVQCRPHVKRHLARLPVVQQISAANKGRDGLENTARFQGC